MTIEASIIAGMLTAPALAARARKVTRPVPPARTSGPPDHVGRSPDADPRLDTTGAAFHGSAQAHQIADSDRPGIQRAEILRP
jgi:hypothetical protein